LKKYIISVTALLLTIMLLVGCGKMSKEEAKKAIKEKKYDAAFGTMLDLAKSGDAEAAALLAEMYEGGLGVEKNEHEARHWLEQAADGGYALSQATLGIRCLDERSSSYEPEKAEKYLLKAAEQGFEDAQMMLALSYDTGMKLRKNSQQAYFWYRVIEKHGKDPDNLAIAKKSQGESLSREERQQLSKKAQEWQPVRVK
jgi:hypothetical protein